MNRCVTKLFCLMLFALSEPMGESRAEEPRPCVLELRNGDFVRGQLRRATDERITFQSDHFATPFGFSKSNVDGMRFAPAVGRPQPEGDFLIEFNNRDVIFGNVLSIQAGQVEIESPQLGLYSFHTDSIDRISRRGPAMEIYPIPVRLQDWTTSDENHWRSEGGHFVTQTPLASLFADVNLPDRALIELEFAWARIKPNPGKPSFSIYLGTDGSEESTKRCFSMEAWEEFSIVQRHVEDDADLASLPMERDEGSMHVYIYLDQPAGKLLLYDVNGKRLADLQVPAANGKGPGLMFLNRNGEFRVRYVHVRGWSGAVPDESAVDEIRVVTREGGNQTQAVSLRDGMVTMGDLPAKGIETESASELPPSEPSEDAAGEEGTDNPPDADTVASSQIRLDQILQIDFPVRNVEPQGAMVANLLDGSRVSGTLESADADQLVIKSQTSPSPLRVPLRVLSGFVLQHGDEFTKPQTAPKEYRLGRVEFMDTRLHGWLVESDVSPSDEASCLVWQSALAEGTSPILRNCYGRLVYREAPKPPAPRNVRALNQRNVIMLGGIQQFQNTPQKSRTIAKKSQRAVHLRSGDVIPGAVTKIDAAGVHIESEATQAKLITHDKVKAAELINNAPTPRLEKVKRERLLTLPRMQRNSPPTHLLFSKKGDVLRGTLISADQDEIRMEVRLNPYSIPRDRVAAVVWLHEDELEGDDGTDGNGVSGATTDTGNGGNEGLEVQVVKHSGARYSFSAESFDEQTIRGSSDILQTMHAKVSEIDQLLLGRFIQSNAKTLQFGRWHLSPAPDPKYVTAAADAEGNTTTTPGTESLLVGEDAPDLKLKMLDESTDFHLTDHRGHFVVLDFWATWCGPCLQVMPMVEKVVEEFSDQDVRLFAVNLEERPAQIQATLERRQLHVDVVLDRDGVAAARYQANAIPQTVIITPEGKVARVFVGSSRNFEAELRAALTELTGHEVE